MQKSEWLRLYSDRRRKGLRMPPRVASLRRLDHICQGCIARDSLRVRMSVEWSGTRQRAASVPSDAELKGPGIYCWCCKAWSVSTKKVICYLLS